LQPRRVVSQPRIVQFQKLLELLVEHNVEFIVVGGLAGVLQGSPLNTRDLDIVYRLSELNIARLLVVLRQLNSVFRNDSRMIEPNESHMRTRGHKLLETSLGPLDCLGTIEEDTDYEALAGHLDIIDLGNFSVQVISLPRLIEVKEKLTRPKDQLALMHLRATLSERSKEQ
jgi:hypothetical protein